MTPTDVTAVLEQQNFAGEPATAHRMFFVEPANHTGEHALQIVNSFQPAIEKRLQPMVGKQVHLFGVRDAADSDDFALLWLNGRGLQQETDSIVFFQDISFRSFFAHASPSVRTCLLNRLGQDKLTRLIANRNETRSADQAQEIATCSNQGNSNDAFSNTK